MDMDTRAVLHLGPGRDSNAVRSFCEQLRVHGGDPEAIRWVAMNMLHCYAKGMRENFPNAQIVYDRYQCGTRHAEVTKPARVALTSDIVSGGHAFRSRYKAPVVESDRATARDYLSALLDYVHLNPVRAGLSAPGKGKGLLDFSGAGCPRLRGGGATASPVDGNRGGLRADGFC